MTGLVPVLPLMRWHRDRPTRVLLRQHAQSSGAARAEPGDDGGERNAEERHGSVQCFATKTANGKIIRPAVAMRNLTKIMQDRNGHT